MVRQNGILTRLGRAASNILGAAFSFVRRGCSSLGVWIMPIVVGALVAAALSGGLSFHRGAGQDGDQDKGAAVGEMPFSEVDLYYSDDYIRVVKTAQERGNDLLASFHALESAWNATSPATPLTIKLVSAPRTEPVTGRSAFPILTDNEVVDESSFSELRGLLDDLRTLILDGDGSGRGRLNRSGYNAHPADRGRGPTAGARSGGGQASVAGPAKLGPKPVSSL
jgi:hypothetical protein